MVLPSSVERLSFFGRTLFTPNAVHSVERLVCLTEVTLGSRSPGCRSKEESDQLSTSVHMPMLPSSLRLLHVTCLSIAHLLNQSAWRCLMACTSLEHLRLSCDCYVSCYGVGQSHEWVKAAHHVHVLDNDPDWAQDSLWSRNSWFGY